MAVVIDRLEHEVPPDAAGGAPSAAPPPTSAGIASDVARPWGAVAAMLRREASRRARLWAD